MATRTRKPADTDTKPETTEEAVQDAPPVDATLTDTEADPASPVDTTPDETEAPAEDLSSAEKRKITMLAKQVNEKEWGTHPLEISRRLTAAGYSSDAVVARAAEIASEDE